jgi:hypothetical protein
MTVADLARHHLVAEDILGGEQHQTGAEVGAHAAPHCA